MSLYFGTTEITNIDNLVPQTGLDITDIWFGSTNVYTVWQTYEGTLPAAINANGSDLKQYQVWGDVGGVGDKTVNLFDKNATDTNNGYDNGHYFSQSTGSVATNATYAISEYIPVLPSTVYTCVYTTYSATWAPTAVYYDSTKAQIGYATHAAGTTFSFTTPANCAFVRMSFLTSATICSLTLGATPPETFVPFGYELDMVSRTENLYDKNNASMNFLGYVNNTTYAVVASSRDSFSIIVPVEPNTTYTVVKPSTSRFRVGLFTSYPYEGEVSTAIYGDRDGNGIDRGTLLTFATSSNTNYILAFIRNYDDAGTTNDQMKNSTTVFKVSTAPIYIGNEPLYENEYVDYEVGKIYRMINGTLTPTDPPVTLPALPTVEGETVIDYAGESVAPEKVLLKYRKEGF